MEEIGCLNKNADKIERINNTWSDTNLDEDYFFPSTIKFTRLMCTCGCTNFEVLSVDSYETAAQCNNCKKYYLVHCG